MADSGSTGGAAIQPLDAPYQASPRPISKPVNNHNRAGVELLFPLLAPRFATRSTFPENCFFGVLHFFRRRNAQKFQTGFEHDTCSQHQIQSRITQILIVHQELVGVVISMQIRRQRMQVVRYLVRSA